MAQSKTNLEIVDGDVDSTARLLDVDLSTVNWTMMRIQQQAAVETTVPFVYRCVKTPSIKFFGGGGIFGKFCSNVESSTTMHMPALIT